MNFHLLASLETQSQPLESSQISVSTALLVILGFLLLWCISTTLELKRRVAVLETPETPSHDRHKADNGHNPIPADIIAAISAAVIATQGAEVRIVRVSRDPHGSLAWSHEGRRHIFHSHKVR